MWVPESVLSRFAVSTEGHQGGYVESRTRMYLTVVEHLPEYLLTGVGANHYYGNWGKSHGFTQGHPTDVMGTHNIFSQVTIFWGLAGFLSLLVLCWQVYRYIPKRCGADSTSLCLLGIAISVGLESMFIDELGSKIFSLGLGLVVGASLWIWPKGIVWPELKNAGLVGSPNWRSRQRCFVNPIGRKT